MHFMRRCGFCYENYDEDTDHQSTVCKPATHCDTCSRKIINGDKMESGWKIVPTNSRYTIRCRDCLWENPMKYEL